MEVVFADRFAGFQEVSYVPLVTMMPLFRPRVALSKHPKCNNWFVQRNKAPDRGILDLSDMNTPHAPPEWGFHFQVTTARTRDEYRIANSWDSAS